MSKRLGGLVLLCAVNAMIGSAQLAAQAPASRARIGVMGGINLATLSGEDTDDLKNRVGPLGGLSYVRNWGGAAGLEMDILYSGKGAKSVEGSDEVTFKINYLEVPVLLRYDFTSTNSVRPHLAVGPSFAFKIGCAGDGKTGNTSVSLDCDALEQTVGVKFKAFDVGATVGGGLDFAMGTKTFTIGARYTMGLMTVIDADDDDTKNRAISLFAGLSMPLRR